MKEEMKCPWLISVYEITYPNSKETVSYFADCYKDACPYYVPEQRVEQNCGSVMVVVEHCGRAKGDEE